MLKIEWYQKLSPCSIPQIQWNIRLYTMQDTFSKFTLTMKPQSMCPLSFWTSLIGASLAFLPCWLYSLSTPVFVHKHCFRHLKLSRIANNPNAYKFLANILLKAFVTANSDKEQTVRCSRRNEKLSVTKWDYELIDFYAYALLYTHLISFT